MTGRDPGERGVALALVLWLVVLLGAVAATVVTSTRSASNVVLNARARTVAQYAAESGVVAAVALVDQHLATAYTPARQAAAFPELARELAGLGEIALGSGRFAVSLTNLNARLDLNHADPQALVGLFSRFTSRAGAQALVDALQDWRDADQLVRPEGAEEPTYRREGSRFFPPNAPLTRLDELRRVRGMTEALVLAVEPYVTVNGDESVDLNAAPEPVIAALPGIGPGGARTVISRRRGGAVFGSVAEIVALLGPSASASTRWLGVAPRRLLLVSVGSMPGHPLRHEVRAAYAIVGQRLQLQSWRERDL